MKTKRPYGEDALAAEVTGFPTMADLQQACMGGYCPTQRPEDGRRVRLLARVLVGHGYPIFDGRRIVRDVDDLN